MTQEREQTPLEKRLAKTESAISRVELISQSVRLVLQAKLGEVFSTGRISRMDFLRRGADLNKEGDVVARINKKTLPTLGDLKADLQRQVQAREEIREAESFFNLIKARFEDGEVTESFYRQIEEAFMSLKNQGGQGEVEPTIAVDERRPDDVEVAPDASRQESKEVPAQKAFVDWRNKTVIVDGREISLSRGEIRWHIFMALAKNARNGVSSDTLNEIAARAGSIDASAGADAIGNLRQALESDQGPSSLIVSERYGRKFRYTLNADVEFVGDKPKLELTEEKIVFEGSELILSEKQSQVLRILAKHVDSEITGSQLSMEAFGNPRAQETYVRDYVRHLKEKLNRDGMPDIIDSKYAGNSSQYILKGVSVAFKEKKEEESDNKPEFSISKQPDTKRVLAHEIREITLPDGKIITIKGEVRARFLELLIDSSEQNQIISGDLARELYGSSDQASKNRLPVLAYRLNKDFLNQIQWEIVQPVTSTQRLRGESGRYFLRRVSKGEVREEEIVPSEGTGMEPEVIAPEARVDDNLRILEQIEGLVAEGLLRQSDLDALRVRLEDEEQPEITEKPIRKPAAEWRETKDFELPDGKPILLRGEQRIKTFELVLNTNEQNQVLIEDMATEIYGENTLEAKARIGANISALNSSILKGLGWEIFQSVSRGDLNRGTKGRYYLRKLGEEIKGTGDTFSVEGVGSDEAVELQDVGEMEELPEPGLPQETPRLVDLAVQGPEFIPYEPSAEDIRTKEEMAVLRAVVSIAQLPPSRERRARDEYTKIHEGMSEFIKSNPQRVRSQLDGVYVNRYTARELKQMFNAAMRKMSEEALGNLLQSQWSEEDAALWEEIRILIADKAHGDSREFQRLVARQIDNAERDFVSGSQSANTWIKVEEVR